MKRSKHPVLEYDVVALGSATVDIFAHSDNEVITIKGEHEQEELLAYPLGSKILIRKIDFKIGGGGTNTAVSFSRLGMKTAFMGCLGHDLRGEQVISLLKKEGVDFIGHFTRAKTNLSIVLDSYGNDRTILAYKDASDKLEYKKLPLQNLKPRLVYSSSMKEPGFDALKRIGQWCRKNKVLFAFNPSNYQAEKGMRYLMPIIRNTDILVLNKEEAELLVGHGDTRTLHRYLSAAGPSITAITDGKNGSSVQYKKKIFEARPKKVKIVETTGAGDAFASAFSCGILLKEDPRFALRMGMAQAESVICHVGAKEKLLTMPEIRKRMKRKISESKAG